MRRRLFFWLLILVLGVLPGLLAGCGGSSHTSAYQALPRPVLSPNTVVPTCAAGDNHTMGECLPRPKSVSLAPVSVPNGPHCVDLSNNDPVFGVGAFRVMKAHGIRCLIVKVTEGTGFIDGTAARMAHDARLAGLLVGGYGFQHVCLDSAGQEALVFVGHLRADGLLGKRTLAPQGDVEYGNGRCNARAWESTWLRIVFSYSGRHAGTYTGAWFWNPVFGGWWDGTSAWISGYGVRWPFTPSGHSHVDMWQYADHGFNGVTSADESVYLDGEQAFEKFANSAVQKPPPPKTISCFGRVQTVNVCVASWQRAITASLRAEGRAKTMREKRLFAQRVRFFRLRILHVLKGDQWSM